MNAHLTPEIVLQITVRSPITILDPFITAKKEVLPVGTVAALSRFEPRDVEWLVLPEHGNKGLVTSAFVSLWNKGLVEVEQKTADGWEDYFDEGN